MDSGAWRDTVLRVAKSQTRLSDFACMQSMILVSAVWFFFPMTDYSIFEKGCTQPQREDMFINYLKSRASEMS